ncbi:unnamed protein product, partial [Didymodactylos carnosus]
ISNSSILWVETSAVPTISSEATWSTTGETVAGGYNSGDQLNQLHSPEDIFVDDRNSVISIKKQGHSLKIIH